MSMDPRDPTAIPDDVDPSFPDSGSPAVGSPPLGSPASGSPAFGSSDASSGGGKPDKVAKPASGEASNVAQTAVDASKNVAGEAASQVSAVVGQTKDQISSLAGQARTELKSQMRSQGQQAGGALSTLSDRLSALADGRPEEAGPLSGMLSEAQSKVRTYADRLNQGGPEDILDDVTSFARRRPGLFLVGAGVAGFVIGRVVKAGAAAAREDDDYTSGRSGMSTGRVDEFAYAPPTTGADFLEPPPITATPGVTTGTTGMSGTTGTGTPGTATPGEPFPGGTV